MILNRHNKTYLSLLLAVCLILTAFVFALPASANSEEFTVPEIIPAKEAAENGYAARIKSEEPDLYTFVFFREDGLRTMRIFGHPVKYVDKDGEIRDITLDLEKHGDGYVTAENSVKTEFPKSLREGVKLTSDGVSVTMIPDDTTQNARLERDGRTVSYKADENTSYEYSLTYSGFKEDIVVKGYTEKTEYAFTLITDGLALREEYGTYFLEDKSGRTKANIGDVIIFDADGRAHESGSLTAETVRPNEAYKLTIVLDEEYLLRASYPIRIDPTIEINYANNGAGAIEDVTINQNVTFSGTSGSLYVGRHPAGSLSRSLMRFPTLSMTGISGITSASVEIRDLMCQGDEDFSIECHVYEKNSPAWSESGTTTWSGVGTSYVGAYLDAHTVSYGAGNATGDFNRYSFNVTSAAQAWVNGTQSPSKGFVFKASASFEGQTGSSIKTWYKTFASYNRASYKPSFSMTYSPVTHIIDDGTYYVNNLNCGKYLRLTASGIAGGSGLVSSLGNSILWDFISVTGGYVIRSKNDTTKYLSVPTTVTSSSVVTETVNGTNYPSRCIWFLTTATGTSGGILKNSYNSRYLYTYGTSVYTSASLGTVGSSTYESRCWRILKQSDMAGKELDSGFSIKTCYLFSGETVSPVIRKSPSNAIWASPSDFTYSGYSTSYLSYNSQTGKFTDISSGSGMYQTTVTATHKVTGRYTTFTLVIRPAAVLVGVDDNVNPNHDHSSALYTIEPNLLDSGYSSVSINTGTFTFNDIKNYLDTDTNNIFVSRGHGGANADGSTLICLNADGAPYFSSDTLQSNSVDLSNMKMVLYIGCSTGAGGNNGLNLPSVTVAKGAEASLGFSSTITCGLANTWTILLFSFLESGETLLNSCSYASDYYLLQGTCMEDYVICGNSYVRIA